MPDFTKPIVSRGDRNRGSRIEHREWPIRPSILYPLFSILLCTCDRPAPSPARATVASTVPAGTDLLIGMGLRDRLVAVSSYDNDKPDVASLPKAGDYLNVDWEVIAATHPSVLLTNLTPARRPAGFDDRAKRLNVRPVLIHVDHLPDIAAAVTALGDAVGAPDAAARANQSLAARLDAVKSKAANLPRVRALIVLDESATSVAGPNTYLDDLLALAGGVNVAAPLGNPYPKIDPEQLRALHPDVVLQLLPNAVDRQKTAAARAWAKFPAVRVCPVYDGYALQPGWHVTDLADTFFRDLHPDRR